MLKNIFFLTFIFLITCTSGSAATVNFSIEIVPENGFVNPPKGQWIKLFNGKSLNDWHHFNSKAAIKNWMIEDGALVCLGAKGPSGSGNIITDQVFGNFELGWDWKVDKGSNSGVLYHIVEDPKYKRSIDTSPEYTTNPGFGNGKEKIDIIFQQIINLHNTSFNDRIRTFRTRIT